MHMKKASMALMPAIIFLSVAHIARAAQTGAETPPPIEPGTFPFPGPFYSPVAMVIGMGALFLGLIIPLTRILLGTLKRRREKRTRVEEE